MYTIEGNIATTSDNPPFYNATGEIIPQIKLSFGGKKSRKSKGKKSKSRKSKSRKSTSRKSKR